MTRSARRLAVTGVLAVAMLVLIRAVPAATERTAKLVAGGLTAIYPWPEDGVNVLANPSFEDVDAAGRPVGWTMNDGKHFTLTSSAAHSGARSMQLKDSEQASATPMVMQSLKIGPGWYSMRGWLKTVDAATTRGKFGGRLGVTWGEGWASTEAASGTRDWTVVDRLHFMLSAEEAAKASFRLQAYGRPQGTLYFDDVELRRLIAPVVEGFLRYPNYRGFLFEDRAQVVRVGVTVRPDEAKLDLGDLSIVLELTREGEDQPLVSARQSPPSSASFEMSLDASALPVGTYLLRLHAARRATGARVFEYPAHRIVKVPADARKDLRVWVDADNVLVLGGRRTFVLGIYDTAGYSNRPKAYEKRIGAIAEAPLNVYINYWYGKAPVTALDALMQTLHAHGMYYLHTVNVWYEGRKAWDSTLQCGGKSPSELGETEFASCMAGVLSKYPGFAGWYTADEQKAEEVPRVFRQYTGLRAGYPGGVTFIAQNGLRELPRWRDAGDVIDAHRYPIFNIPEGKLAPLEYVLQWADGAQAAVDRSRPVWTVVQFYQHGAKGHWPTYDELRAMSYMGIVGGAKGLLYWSYGAKALEWVKDPARREELWQRLVKVTREIKSLEPALLSPDAPDVLAGAPSGGVRVLAKRTEDARYVFAVNPTPEAVESTFRLAEPGGAVEVIGEKRTIPAGTGGFTDAFAPYGVHVYRLPGAGVKGS